MSGMTPDLKDDTRLMLPEEAIERFREGDFPPPTFLNVGVAPDGTLRVSEGLCPHCNGYLFAVARTPTLLVVIPMLTKIRDPWGYKCSTGADVEKAYRAYAHEDFQADEECHTVMIAALLKRMPPTA